jgi:hypothetical protein
MSNDVGHSETERLLPSSAGASLGIINEEVRDNFATSAVRGFHTLFLIIVGTIGLSIATSIIVILADIPQYWTFIVLGLGHIICAIQLYRIIIRANKALFTPSTPENSARIGIEKRLVIVKYVYLNLIPLVSAAFIIVIFEIMLFLCTQGLVSLTNTLIPIYLFSIVGLIVCVLLR